MAKIVFNAGVFFDAPLYPAPTTTTVTVVDANTGLPAALWEDFDGTVTKSNPFTLGTDGVIRFYADPGRYHITATNGASSRTWPDVLLIDPDAWALPLLDGAAATILTEKLTASRALISDENGDVAVSPVTGVELGYVAGVTSGLQGQINGKQNTITGAATTITSANLTTNRAVVSNGSGKVAASAVTATELGHVAGVTSAIQTQLNARELTANKGAANGYAPLDGTGRVPAANLPAYVDDVVEYANLSAFPATGTAGMLYVALDTNRIYRWSGSAYAEISPSPGSTDSVPEGSVNLYFTNARALAAVQSALDAKANASVTLTAGTGLTGGGNLTVNRTLSVVYGTAAGTSAQGNDARLSDAREWTESTVSQAEAEAGTATGRRAWTSQRVRQAIVAWWATVSGTKQDTITGAASTVTTANLTANRVMVSDGSGKVAVSDRTTTQLGFLDATSSIQTQLNARALTSSLGTAAAGTLVTSATDVTAGRILTVGYEGLGRGFLDVPDLTSDEVNAGRFFRQTPDAVGGHGTSFGGTIAAPIAGASFGFISITSNSAYIGHKSGANGIPSWRELWHAGNMLNIGTTAASARTALGLGTAATANTGPGNGLDADTVDGVQASGFVQTAGAQTAAGSKTWTGAATFSGGITVQTAGATLVSTSSGSVNAIIMSTNGGAGGADDLHSIGAISDPGITPRANPTIRIGSSDAKPRDLWVSGGNAYVSGEVHCTDLVTTSARRFKTDIATLRPDGEAFDALRPVTYREADTGNPSLGLIAEELREIYPELVAMDPDGQCRGVNYPKIVALLIAELQDLRSRVAAVEGA